MMLPKYGHAAQTETGNPDHAKHAGLWRARNWKQLVYSVAPWKPVSVKTVTVDADERVRIAGVRPREVYAVENNGNGIIVLTRVTTQAEEAFPPGSLLQYVTPERDDEVGLLFSGCVARSEKAV